jgi:hypothetical protein
MFKDKLNCSVKALYLARDKYKWDLRVSEIRNKLVTDQNLELEQKFKNYIEFADDVINESMERFYHGERGAITVREIKDLKHLVETITHLVHGGIKKKEIKVEDLTDQKASKVLEVLASDITDAEIIEDE